MSCHCFFWFFFEMYYPCIFLVGVFEAFLLSSVLPFVNSHYKDLDCVWSCVCSLFRKTEILIKKILSYDKLNVNQGNIQLNVIMFKLQFCFEDIGVFGFYFLGLLFYFNHLQYLCRGTLVNEILSKFLTLGWGISHISCSSTSLRFYHIFLEYFTI